MKSTFSILFFVPIISFAQLYPIEQIPDSLKENANAILRFEEYNITISNISKATIKHKYVITILDETGDRYVVYNNQYDDLISLSDISANLYDAKGIKIKSVKRKDIYDVKDNGDDFLTNSRTKAFSFNHKTYPYTVEFEDEQSLNGIYYLPNWMPVKDERFAVQQSKFIVETPSDYNLRFKQFNYKSEPNIVKSKKNIYSWELNNFKAIDDNSFMPEWYEITPTVFLAPTQFSISGYTGEMDTWSDYGKFNLTLNNNKDLLPDNIKQTVHKLTDNITNVEEKINILYNYLQNNTRYISIQLGIGGWQPLDAKFVSEKKYGDCKALSNFMISLLKEANILAYYTIIKSGKYVTTGLFDDFPRSGFNHIITCVPLKNDTMWLECTSQSISAGYMGSSTGNRKVIVVTEKGGVIASTPKFEIKNNFHNKNATAVLNENGDLAISSTTNYSGTQHEFFHGLLQDANEVEKLKYLNKYLTLPTYTVNKFNYIETKGRVPVIKETLDITAQSYATITGKRMFIVPNLFTKADKLDESKTRTYDVVYRSAYHEIDSIEIKIPKGFKIEMMPKNIDISNKFGKYKMTYSFNNDAIKTIRYYEQNTNRFPASEYINLANFYNEMFKSDRAKIVLTKQD